MRFTFVALFAILPLNAADKVAFDPWPDSLPFPQGMTRYKRAEFTQSIAVVDSRDSIERVHRTWNDAEYQVNGGLIGIEGVRSDLYKNATAAKAKPFIGDIGVKNSFGFLQMNRGWRREYANGSRFLDVLSTDGGKVFEIRSREKIQGDWKSTVLFEDVAARPKGYTGKLTKTCAECHSDTNSGNYNGPLVAGSDGVISDPVPALEKKP